MSSLAHGYDLSALCIVAPNHNYNKRMTVIMLHGLSYTHVRLEVSTLAYFSGQNHSTKQESTQVRIPESSHRRITQICTYSDEEYDDDYVTQTCEMNSLNLAMFICRETFGHHF